VLTNATTAKRDGASELFTRYSPAIYRYCLRRLRSREEAEDALQVTYLNAWRSLESGFQPADPRPWLFQIAANVCSSNLRSMLTGPRLELREPETLDKFARANERTEILSDLTAAVRELPDRQRRALVLRDWQGLAYDEIAADLAISDAAVETLIFRARRSVAATLAKRDWRPNVAASARAALAWPLGVFHAKAALTGGTAHAKSALAIACGTAAPLVAFGILQTVLFSADVAKEAHKRTPPVEAPLRPAREHGLRPLLAREGSEQRPVETEQKQREKRGEEPKHASAPQGPASHPASPSQPEAPSGAPDARAAAVLCHGTNSKSNPGVTITVAPQATVNGHRDDATGACG
jgi:RNA polymerase sigma-70 factor (ECF subfamily)